jgi:uncharacterized protein YgiM (DUF1202 family)
MKAILKVRLSSVLDKGDKVDVISNDGEWAKIRRDYWQSWIETKYLTICD